MVKKRKLDDDETTMHLIDTLQTAVSELSDNLKVVNHHIEAIESRVKKLEDEEGVIVTDADHYIKGIKDSLKWGDYFGQSK